MESPRGFGGTGTLEEATVVSRTRPVSDVSFRAFLREFGAPRVHWASPDGLEIAGCGAATQVVAAGEGRFDAVRERAASLFDAVDADGPPATRPRLLGGFAFDENHEEAPPWEGFPPAAFVLPRVQLTRAAGATYLTVNRVGPAVEGAGVEESLADVGERAADLPAMRPSGDPPGVAATRHTTSKEAWTRMVEGAVERIRAGDLLKVVLATALEVELESPIDTLDVLERLRRTYPDCYRFLIQPDGKRGFFGPPPERLVKLEGRGVETEALAGSVPRGDTPEADADLATSLVESEKLQHEQGLVVKAIREQLAPLGEVSVGEQAVRKLATIQHLRTPISATLDRDEHVLSLVEALHPTPAVGGLPPGAAWETIRGTESFDRGWYAAPVGWFDAAGDGEFAVAIRSGVAGGRHATLFAGNGIVADSDPEREWEEIQPKYRPILDELG